MEADWTELATVTLPSLHPPGHLPSSTTGPCSATAFDALHDLLWTGNEYGLIVSYVAPDLQTKYTSFRAHHKDEGPVKGVLVCDKGVISLSAKSIHCSNRRGITQWHLKDDAFAQLACLSFTSKNAHEILVAGQQSVMFVVNTDRGTIEKKISINAHYNLMKAAGQYICAATPEGLVHVLNPNNEYNSAQEWQAHAAWLIDMDANADFLVTCGGHYRHEGYALDHALRIFDIKNLTMKPPVPVSVIPGPAFVRLDPRMQTTAIICSNMGQLQVVDILNQLIQPSTHSTFITTNGAFIHSLEISAPGEAVALTDTSGQIHLWGSPTKVTCSEYSKPLDWYEATDSIRMDFVEDKPSATIGVPFYRDPLLSNWPNHSTYDVGAPLPKIDDKMITQLQSNGFAKNGKGRRRNQVEKTRSSEGSDKSVIATKFLHEKEKARAAVTGATTERRKSDTFEALIDRAQGKEDRSMYDAKDIEYSRFGIDDFDFKFWNDTPYPGLEGHISNSYANALLQLFKFIPCMRNLALRHTASSCLDDTCLLCQLGFLIDMLEKGTLTCHPSNFLKTLESINDAHSQDLLEQTNSGKPLSLKVQLLNLFLVSRFTEDYKRTLPNDEMNEAVALSLYESIRCSACKVSFSGPGDARPVVQELVYDRTPLKTPGRNGRAVPFSSLLKVSIEGPPPAKGWCNTCRRYQTITRVKNIRAVPPVLLINTNATAEPVKSLWATPKWLPHEIGIILQNGTFYCFEGNDIKTHLQRGAHEMEIYELVGVVCDVTTERSLKQHLVSVINVTPSSPAQDSRNRWHLFNDHHVRKLSIEDALRFDASSKLPAVIAYQKRSARHYIDNSWKHRLDTSILYQNWRRRQDADPKRFKVLSPPELPGPGTPIALDAEFVVLRNREIEIPPEGKERILRPRKEALARVSVLRGTGADEGVPFIDDYIMVTEPIVDYVTQYSGIHPGDLDPGKSPHALVSLKVIYKKLWLLLNLGCVFIGHGLIKDFRTINIHVPPSQVTDTYSKFYDVEQKRRLGLRFLVWHFLHIEIQNDDQRGHDSIEDAAMALRLYRKWQEFEDAGVTAQMIHEMYLAGAKTYFKVPGQENSGRPGTSAGHGSMTDYFEAKTPERGNSRAHTPLTMPRMKVNRVPGNTGTMTMSRDIFGSPLRRPGGSDMDNSAA